MKLTLAAIVTLLPGFLAGPALACPVETQRSRRCSQGIKARQATSGPPGATTLGIPRTKVGSVPYGTLITRCTTPGVVALTFDDGPSSYTEELLDILARYRAKATFFIVGNQFGPIYEAPWAGIVKRTYAEGHQIAHHTWRHSDLSAVSTTDRLNEIVWAEMAFRDTLGFFPTYLRPPYGNCDGSCLAQLGDLGYHVVTWSVDTLDWEHPNDIETSMGIFDSELTTGDIVLSHDTKPPTVEELAEHMLITAQNRGLRAVTLGECLGDPQENWYRQATGGTQTTTTSGEDSTATSTSTGSSPTGLKASVDGRCGASSKQTCAGSIYGRCCSQWGWCGDGNDWCAAGCQPGYGLCTV